MRILLTEAHILRAEVTNVKNWVSPEEEIFLSAFWQSSVVDPIDPRIGLGDARRNFEALPLHLRSKEFQGVHPSSV